MAKELMSRDQVKVEDTWNVNDIYKTEELWEADVKLVNDKLEELTKFAGKVCESANTLLKVLEETAFVEEKIEKAYFYSARLFDEDQGNSKHRSMNQKMVSLYAKMESDLSFITPEILACDSAKLEQFYNEEAGLELYKKEIKEIVRLKAHTLSAELEKVVAMTAEMSNTPGEVYEAFTNIDLTFPNVKDENGEESALTNGNFVPFLMSADRNVRENVFKAYYGTMKGYLNTFAAAYSGEVKQRMFYSRVRNYESNLKAAVDANNVSPEVYDNLVKTVNANLDKLHAYVSLRKKCLGVDELHMYDIYTPMIADVAKKVTYKEAQETICKALSVLGDDYVALLKEGFANRWIDVYENKGKR
ncbi:MAG: oligoendopeptidase F, partial [Pseudobutyrivibrio sp.]|nr:oligoendopeptidase F [Pseudobutyrivibrio sp.]